MIKRSKIIIIIMLISAIILPIYKHKITNDNNTKAYREVDNYLKNTTKEETNKIININSKHDKKYEYIAILEIPSINLKRGLVSSNSKYNNVKYNIQIIENSQLPDNEYTNLILAAHNGTSEVSFFKDLEKLNQNDEVYLYYNGYKYIYKINNSYTVDKTGSINIRRNALKTTLTLITCKDTSENEQIIYIAYLDKKIIY